MPETPIHEAVPVLNYDPMTRAHSGARRRRRITCILVSAVIGAIIGLSIRPRSYRATGYLATHLAQNVSMEDHVAAIQSPANLAAAAAAAKVNGQTLTPGEIAHDLQVRALTASNLIEISYIESDPAVSTAITNSLIRNYIAATPLAGMASLPAPVPSAQARPQALFIVGGFIVGLAGGWIIVALRRR